jgi:hypothetical protein
MDSLRRNCFFTFFPFFFSQYSTVYKIFNKGFLTSTPAIFILIKKKNSFFIFHFSFFMYNENRNLIKTHKDVYNIFESDECIP